MKLNLKDLNSFCYRKHNVSLERIKKFIQHLFILKWARKESWVPQVIM